MNVTSSYQGRCDPHQTLLGDGAESFPSSARHVRYCDKACLNTRLINLLLPRRSGRPPCGIRLAFSVGVVRVVFESSGCGVLGL